MHYSRELGYRYVGGGRDGFNVGGLFDAPILIKRDPP
jgi:hypothetical protein